MTKGRKNFDKSVDADLAALEIACRLKRTRESMGLSQMQVAIRSGLSPQQISDIESFRRSATLPTFIMYMKGVGIDLLEILKEKNIGGK